MSKMPEAWTLYVWWVSVHSPPPDGYHLTLLHGDEECKESVQDRPYISRPSRTQQLLNPKLVPELKPNVPEEFTKK